MKASFIFAGRNDNHGFVLGRGTDAPTAVGRFEDKATAVWLWNREVLDAAGLDWEVIFVEWGMVDGWMADRFVNAVGPRARGFLVPDRIVARFQYPPMKFHEYVAKNIGLRRASGSYCVATNSDILIPPDHVQGLMTLNVEDHVLYRTPRRDWGFKDRDIAQIKLPSPQDFLEYINWLAFIGGAACWGNASGDYAGATPAGWHKLGGYIEAPDRMRHLDAELCDHAINDCGMRIEGLPPIWHRDHPDSSQYWATLPELSGGPLSPGTRQKHNNENWGLARYSVEQVAERVWLMGDL